MANSWAAGRAEELKRHVSAAAPARSRDNVRFGKAEQRRNATRITVENLDSVDITSIVTKFPECAFFIRACATQGGSRLDVYIPEVKPAVVMLKTTAIVLWIASAISFVSYILLSR
jgi:hypothetical protein